MIDVNEPTIGQIREIAKLAGGACGVGTSHSLEVGKCYYIRTVTFHYTGKLRSITDTDMVLDDAAWVADSGRWSEALKTGKLGEVEPYPGHVIVSRGGVIDVSPWLHALPRDVK